MVEPKKEKEEKKKKGEKKKREKVVVQHNQMVLCSFPSVARIGVVAAMICVHTIR